MKKVTIITISAFFILSILGLYTKNRDKEEINITPIIERERVSGIQLVMSDQKGNSQKFQERYYKYGNEIEDTTIFQAASLSKVVFAYITLKLYDEGVIDLDTPIMNYYDNKRFAPGEDSEYAKLLTPRMVLAHRTGLPNWAASPSSEEWPTSEIKFKKRPYQLGDSLPYFTYSGEGYAYLQHTLEHLTGKSLNELATKYIFGPLKMENTWYGWRRDFETKVTVGHQSDGTPAAIVRYPRANCGYTLMTCAHDYIKFLEKLSIGWGLKDETFKEMTTPQYEDTLHRIYGGLPISWGLGVGLTDDGAIWHWGDNGSFKSFFIIYSSGTNDSKRILHYLSNSRNGLKILPDLLNEFFTPQTKNILDIHIIPTWLDYHYN